MIKEKVIGLAGLAEKTLPWAIFAGAAVAVATMVKVTGDGTNIEFENGDFPREWGVQPKHHKQLKGAVARQAATYRNLTAQESVEEGLDQVKTGVEMGLEEGLSIDQAISGAVRSSKTSLNLFNFLRGN